VTVYVSVPQVPLGLRFEEPLDDVVDHFQGLISDGATYCYDGGDGQVVLVNFGVIAAVTFSEGVRTFEVSELHRAINASLPHDRDG